MPAYFTRGSGHNEKAQYSERADDYANNLDRLARKFETARTLVPKPEVEMLRQGQGIGLIAYGTTHWAIVESRDQLKNEARLDDVVPAAAGVSVHARGLRVHRHVRPRLRRRAEPRQPDAVAAQDGVHAGAVRQASQHPPLRRAADRRPIGDDGVVETGTRNRPRPDLDSGRIGRPELTGRASGDTRNVDTNTASARERRSIASASSRSPIAAARRRCAPGAGTTPSPSASSTRSSSSGIDPTQVDQALGHRLLEQEPGLFPEQRPRLQLRARPHAVGRPPARSSPTAR